MTTAREPNQTMHDPVCHMDIDMRQAAGRSDYNGHTYYFCATECKEKFDANPDAALEGEASYNHDAGANSTMETGAETAGTQNLTGSMPTSGAVQGQPMAGSTMPSGGSMPNQEGDRGGVTS